MTLRGEGLRESAIDTLEEFKADPESYTALYLEILLKKSRLSSRERSFNKRIGDIALIDTRKNHFQDQEKVCNSCKLKDRCKKYQEFSEEDGMIFLVEICAYVFRGYIVWRKEHFTS